MRLHRLESLFDPLYEFFLDGFQDGFPSEEQLPLSHLHRLLKARGVGDANPPGAADTPLLVVLDDDDQPAGLAMWSAHPVGLACLWYLWVHPRRRGQGVGAWAYRAVLGQAVATMPNLGALTFEVERPDLARSAEQAGEAERRITFYRRLGAKLAVNVAYLQHCGRESVPPLPMHLMVHPLAEQDPARLLDLLAACYGEALQRPEQLALV